MNYKYILFDFDGTLSDSAAGVMASFESTLKALGLPCPGRDILISFVGPPLADTFADYFGLKGEDNASALSIFRKAYASVGLSEQAMFEGVPEMLERLRSAGRVLAVATSKRERFARQICEGYGIDSLFAIIAGSSDDDVRNQKDAIIAYALDEMGVKDRSEVLMVGDRLYDVEGAKRCGIDCMGVTYGYGSRKELEDAGAKYLASSTREVADMILDRTP